MIEKPWLKHYEPGLPHTLRPYPECTLLDVMSDTVRQRPDHTALIFKGTRMSYARLEQLTNAFGAALVAQGVKKGERVALLLPNSPQSIIAQLGAWKAGAIAAPINSLYTPRELEQALNEIGAETIVVLTRFYDKVKSLQARTQVRRVIATNIKEYLPAHLRVLYTLAKEKKEGDRIRLQPGDLWWHDLMREHADAPRPAVPLALDDPAILLFSGGTTGTPKAALGTHHALLMSAMQLHAYGHTVLADWDDIITLVMPMFHVYGNMALNTSLVARWPMAVVPNPRDIDDLIDTIMKVRPAVLHGVPTLFIALLNHPKVQAGQGGLQVDEGVLCRGGAADGRDQATVRGADGRVAARRVWDDRDDAGGGRLPGSRGLQRRLDRHPGAGCGRADRRHRYGEANSSAGRDRRGAYQRAADHGGLLGAPGRNGRDDPRRLGIYWRLGLHGQGRIPVHRRPQEGSDQARRLPGLASARWKR